MTESELARIVITHLEAKAVDYVLVGGIAYNFYGIPRATNDADFVVSIEGPVLNALLRTLPPEFEVEPQARMELFTGTMRWVVSICGTPLKVEFFLLGNDPHHRVEFQRRKRKWLPLIKAEAWVACGEDLIIQKLRWARGKDLDDVRNIVAVSGDVLDFGHIEKWAREHGTWERFQEIRRLVRESLTPPKLPPPI